MVDRLKGCQWCDHSGWIFVDEHYAARAFPDPAPLQLDSSPADVEAYEARVRDTVIHRRSALNSVHPCPQCRPFEYDRWRQGIFGQKRAKGDQPPAGPVHVGEAF